VTASRADVLEPSETSTRSDFGTWDAAMPDIIPGAHGFVSQFNDAFRLPARLARAAMQRYSWTNNLSNR
jgi:hypothetical protein